ncbi:MAG: inositol monophosphatase family protein [Gammaproteobacteria bacterium]
MNPLLNIGIRAARRAGDIIIRNINRLDSIRVSTKGRNDFVSEVDRMAEREIISTIQRSHPDHAFLAEESGASGESDTRWIIDPLDGTTNFLHGFPVFAVSLAAEVKGRLEHAVVYDPMRQELFTASRGVGAQLDGRRIRVTDQPNLEQSLIGTGFPFRGKEERLDEYMPMFRAVMASTAGIRRPGAASLDLAYVAAGRLDGFWESGLQPWDMAAGVLLIQEAGGIVSDLEGGDRWMTRGDILTANVKLHRALGQLLQSHPQAGRTA